MGDSLELIIQIYDNHNNQIATNLTGYVVLQRIYDGEPINDGFYTQIVAGYAYFSDIPPRLLSLLPATYAYKIGVYTAISSSELHYPEYQTISWLDCTPAYVGLNSSFVTPQGYTQVPITQSFTSTKIKTEQYTYYVTGSNPQPQLYATVKARSFYSPLKHSQYVEGVDQLSTDTIYTLKDPTDICISTKCDENGEASFELLTMGTYLLYETNQYLFGTYGATYFNSVISNQPQGWTSTTPRTYIISITQKLSEDLLFEYGHTITKPFNWSVPDGYVICNPENNISQLLQVNLLTGKTTSLSTYSGYNLNAIGFNVFEGVLYVTNDKSDGMQIYRIENDPPSYPLYRVDNSICQSITTYQSVNFSPTSAIGCFDYDGHYYIDNYVSNSTSLKFYAINFQPFSLNYGLVTPVFSNATVSQGDFNDWAYNAIDQSLYYFDHSGIIKSISLTGNIASYSTDLTNLMSEDKTSLNMVGAFKDVRGIMYLLSSNYYLYKVDLTHKSKIIQYVTKLTAGAGSGDGANSGAPLLIDYGNAPAGLQHMANYKTLSSQNGPRHVIDSNLKLGDLIMAEDDGYSEYAPLDNDGIIDLKMLDPYQSVYKVTAKVYNETNEDAFLYAWLDFNTDGDFNVDEACSSIPITISSKVDEAQFIPLLFNRPLLYQSGKNQTVLRVRLTTDTLTCSESLLSTAGLTIDDRSLGVASNGEVEDYLPFLQQMPVIDIEKIVSPTETVMIGDEISYILNIHNYGSVSLLNLTVQDQLPSHIQFIAGTYMVGTNEPVPISVGDLENGFSVGSVELSEVITVTCLCVVI